jgi:uncharacterized membrane protein
MLLINRSLELKLSIEWIKASFATFREKPLQFIVLGIFSTLVSLMPLFGAFMMPLFVTRFAVISRKIEQNEPVLFSTIFDDFFAHRQVLILAFINFAITAIIFIVQYIAEHTLKQHGIDITAPGSLLMLIFFIPALILQMALWLSPLICLYNNDIEPLPAMWMSLKACGFNVVTFLIYSLLVIFFTVLAIVPIGLGLLVWLPMMNIVTYFIYKSVFIRQ